MTRTEEDLRSALESLEHHAPDAQAVLADIRIKIAARRVVYRRRWRRWALAGVPLATTAAVVALISGPWLVTDGPGGPATTRAYGPAPGARAAATLLRQLATTAAAQPTPALGPYVYTETANWGIQLGRPHYGLNYRSHTFNIDREWVGPGGNYFVVSDPYGKLSPGLARSGGDRVNPMDNLGWAWNNPATLPASPRLLMRHLLSNPRRGDHVARLASGAMGVIGPYVLPASFSWERPATAPAVFGDALQLMRAEPLRPAVRATLLRLMAQAVGKIPGSSQRFFDLGTVTDRAGHLGVTIGQISNEVMVASGKDSDQYRAVHVATFWLTIYIFDPRTGALSGEEYATCTHLVTSVLAANKACYPDSYSQYLQIRAAPSLPLVRLGYVRPAR